MNKISQKPSASLLKLNGQGDEIKTLKLIMSLWELQVKFLPPKRLGWKVVFKLPKFPNFGITCKVGPEVGLFGKGWGSNIIF